MTAQQQYDAKRGTAHQRGYTSAWQKARDGHLRNNPLCDDHQKRGQLVPAEVVDHKVAPKLKEANESGDPERIAAARLLFWDRKNWQSLCKSCHDSVKQRIEKSGRVPGCGLDGRPLDPSHPWNRGQGG
ncbi:MAG: HNH endonuclease [Acidovorax sp.]